MKEYIRVRTFGDQDAGRTTVSTLAAEMTADLMFAMDTLTFDGDGLERAEMSNLPDDKEYLSFRAFFSAQTLSTIQAFAGRLLGRLAVDQTGAAYLFGKAEFTDRRAENLSLASRLNWLIGEIPALIERYGQLYEGEDEKALSICARVDALDLAIPSEKDQAMELWVDLELWHRQAQPGARIMRGDEEALGLAKDWLARLKLEVDAEEKNLRHIRAVSSGEKAPSSPEERAEAVDVARERRDVLQAQVRKLEQQVQTARKEADIAATQYVNLMLDAS